MLLARPGRVGRRDDAPEPPDRGSGRRAGAAADRVAVDRGRARPGRGSRARVQPFGLRDQHADRDGARARDRLRAVRGFAVPRGASRGRAKLDAIAASATNANRAVVFSGTTFVIAMFGTRIVPSSIMRSLAVGPIVVGTVSVVASATLLPALLGLFGDGVDRLRIPLIGAIEKARLSPGRHSTARTIAPQKRPSGSADSSERRLLFAAAVPLFGMHVGTSGRDRAARPLRVEAALRRAPARLPGGDLRPGRDRCRRRRNATRSQTGTDPAPDEARCGPALRPWRDRAFGGRLGRGALGSGPGRPSGDDAVSAERDLRSTMVPAAFKHTTGALAPLHWFTYTEDPAGVRESTATARPPRSRGRKPSAKERRARPRSVRTSPPWPSAGRSTRSPYEQGGELVIWATPDKPNPGLC